MVDTILVTPPSFEMGSTETLALGFDVSGDLSNGETIQSAVALLVNRQTGVAYPSGLVDAPDIDNGASIITQIVSNLEAGIKYRLVITFIVDPGVKEPAAALIIDCPF